MGNDYQRIRVQYYLRHWKMLEENRNILTIYEIEMGKLLFNSLAKMSEENLNLIKMKYYDSDSKTNFDKTRGIYQRVTPINDDVVAYHLNIPVHLYREKRLVAENELKEIMLEVGQGILYSKDKIYLKINRFLYIKSVEIKSLKYLGSGVDVGNVTLTKNTILDKKQVFDMSDEVTRLGVEKLENVGFLREALSIDEQRELE